MKAARRKLLHLKTGFWLFAALLPSSTLAQPWYIPTKDIASVEIENPSYETQSLWLAKPITENDSYMSEINIDIPARSRKIIAIPQDVPWVQIRSYMEVPVVLRETFHNTVLPAGRFNRWSYKAPSAENAQLLITNLSPIDQDGLILISATRGNQYLRLPAWQSLQVPISLSRGEYIEVRAKFPVMVSFDGKMWSPQALKPKVDSGTFEMQSSDGQQSFTFSTSDPAVIEELRWQLKGKEKKSVLARVGISRKPSNFDLANPYSPSWSWEIEEILGFQNTGTCNGSAQFIEDFLLLRIAHADTVCFLDFKVKREL